MNSQPIMPKTIINHIPPAPTVIFGLRIFVDNIFILVIAIHSVFSNHYRSVASYGRKRVASADAHARPL